MQNFDIESTVFERGKSLVYISVKKLFFTFLNFFLFLLISFSLSVTDNMVPTSLYGRTHINFINNEIIPALKSSKRQRLVIYSDGCAYQNRNVQLSNALFNCALENKL